MPELVDGIIAPMVVTLMMDALTMNAAAMDAFTEICSQRSRRRSMLGPRGGVRGD